jgi:hypothetical protein
LDGGCSVLRFEAGGATLEGFQEECLVFCEAGLVASSPRGLIRTSSHNHPPPWSRARRRR